MLDPSRVYEIKIRVRHTQCLLRVVGMVSRTGVSKCSQKPSNGGSSSSSSSCPYAKCHAHYSRLEQAKMEPQVLGWGTVWFTRAKAAVRNPVMRPRYPSHRRQTGFARSWKDVRNR